MEHLDVQTAHRLIHGQLNAQERARAETHLETCPRCRELLEAERAFSSILHLAPDRHAENPPPSPNPSSRIEAAMDHMAGIRRRRQLVTAACAATAIMLTIALVLQLSGTSTSPSPADLAAELRISTEMQSKVVANLAALQALDRDPWLEQDYESVSLLDRLIAGEER